MGGLPYYRPLTKWRIRNFLHCGNSKEGEDSEEGGNSEEGGDSEEGGNSEEAGNIEEGDDNEVVA